MVRKRMALAVFALLLPLSLVPLGCSDSGDYIAPPPPETVAATGVGLDAKALHMVAGSSASLTAQVWPSGATDRAVTWSDHGSAVATVSGSGDTATVRAVAGGTATITVATADGRFTEDCHVFVDDGVAHVTGVTLDRPALSLVPGGTGSLSASVQPPSAADRGVAWVSSNEAVATVAGAGATAFVTGVANGQAVITARTADGGHTATCAVTVAPYTVPVQSMVLNNTSLEVLINGTGTLTATLTPPNAAVTPAWTSSNTGVATVPANTTGLTCTITPVAAGFTTVTVAAGGLTATCAVTVRVIPVTSIALDKPTMEMPIRTTAPLTATLSPTNATERGVTWSSSNASVATVTGSGTSATVTAVGGGAANITAIAQSGITARCAVTVVTIPVTGVTLSKNSMEVLLRGGAAHLAAALQPSNTTDRETTWSSSNPSVATVTASGVSATVTPLTAGNTTITVNASGRMATCAVTVVDSPKIARMVQQPFKAGYTNSMAIKTNGTLWGWGQNNYGKLGDGTTEAKTVPTQVSAVNTWTHIAAGYTHTAAVRADGTLWTWGYNTYGQLGLEDTTTRDTGPVQVGSGTDWAYVAVGDNQTVAIKTDGTLWAWGRNNYGQAGQGGTTPATQTTPIQVGTGTDWVAAATGTNHLIALKDNGTIWGWGLNSNGQLGIGNTNNQYTPVQEATGATNWVALAVGDTHSMAIKTDGSLWMWGAGTSGKLGQGNTTQQNSPVRITTTAGGDTWKSIAGGGGHTVAVKTDGSLWAWGDGGYGQLGQGNTSQQTSPVRVGADNDWVAVSAGQHTMAMKADGSISTCGYNSAGQIGDGTTGTANNKTSLVRVGDGFRLP